MLTSNPSIDSNMSPSKIHRNTIKDKKKLDHMSIPQDSDVCTAKNRLSTFDQVLARVKKATVDDTEEKLFTENLEGKNRASSSSKKKKKKKKKVKTQKPNDDLDPSNNKPATTVMVGDDDLEAQEEIEEMAKILDQFMPGEVWMEESKRLEIAKTTRDSIMEAFQLKQASDLKKLQQLHHHRHHEHHHLQQHLQKSVEKSMVKMKQEQQRPNTTAHKSKQTDSDDIWYVNDSEERQRIREYWMTLSEQERKELVRLEKETLLKKIKEHQRQTCTCDGCGRKRSAIEDELEMLFDAYYKELERFTNQRLTSFASAAPNNHLSQYQSHESKLLTPADVSCSSKNDESASQQGSDTHRLSNQQPQSFIYEFGSSLTANGGILSVADDFLSNDGKKFLDLMEQLAERKLRQMDEENSHHDDHDEEYSDDGYYPAEKNERQTSNMTQDWDDAYGEESEEEEDYAYEYESDEEEEEDDDDEDYELTIEQRMEEGRRMFQIFAAKMFEQRVMNAYREKMAYERQQRLLAELEEEERLNQEREQNRIKKQERKKALKKLQQQMKEEERLQKEREKKLQEEKEREERNKKAEQERKRRELEKQKELEAIRRKEEEELRRQQEEKLRKEREVKKAEEKKRLEIEKKEREERLRLEKEQKRTSKVKAPLEKKVPAKVQIEKKSSNPDSGKNSPRMREIQVSIVEKSKNKTPSKDVESRQSFVICKSIQSKTQNSPSPNHSNASTPTKSFEGLEISVKKKKQAKNTNDLDHQSPQNFDPISPKIKTSDFSGTKPFPSMQNYNYPPGLHPLSSSKLNTKTSMAPATQTTSEPSLDQVMNVVTNYFADSSLSEVIQKRNNMGSASQTSPSKMKRSQNTNAELTPSVSAFFHGKPVTNASWAVDQLDAKMEKKSDLVSKSSIYPYTQREQTQFSTSNHMLTSQVIGDIAPDDNSLKGALGSTNQSFFTLSQDSFISPFSYPNPLIDKGSSTLSISPIAPPAKSYHHEGDLPDTFGPSASLSNFGNICSAADDNKSIMENVINVGSCVKPIAVPSMNRNTANTPAVFSSSSHDIWNSQLLPSLSTIPDDSTLEEEYSKYLLDDSFPPSIAPVLPSTKAPHSDHSKSSTYLPSNQHSGSIVSPPKPSGGLVGPGLSHIGPSISTTSQRFTKLSPPGIPNVWTTSQIQNSTLGHGGFPTTTTKFSSAQTDPSKKLNNALWN